MSDLKSIIHVKDGVTYYWHSFMERWETGVVKIQEWKAEEVLPHVQEKHKDLQITMIDSPD